MRASVCMGGGRINNVVCLPIFKNPPGLSRAHLHFMLRVALKVRTVHLAWDSGFRVQALVYENIRVHRYLAHKKHPPP